MLHFIFVLLFKYNCPLFPPPPTPTSHTQSYPSLALSMGPLYLFLDNPSPAFPCYPFSHFLVSIETSETLY